MPFVHLHCHSHYSIGRALPRPRELVERAAALGMPAIALTDNNSIAGMHEFHQAGRELGIDTILGCELDVLPSLHKSYRGQLHRLLVLVENEQGYQNLARLLTLMHDRPAELPPQLSLEQLAQQAAGLVFLVGSRRSELYYWLREGRAADTRDYLHRLAAAVGPDQLYFEVSEHPHPRTRRIMEYILELSEFLKFPAVATQNVHFLDPDDMPAYCALRQFPHLLAPEWPPPEEELPTLYFTNEAEMNRCFGYRPQLLEQSLAIAQRCRFRSPKRRGRIPAPELERGQDPPSVLWDLALRGASARYGGLSDILKERLSTEYADLRGEERDSLDLSEYLLLLHEISDFLREGDYCRGVGRGRLVHSAMAYSLGITDIDPLAYDLPYLSLREDPERLPPLDIEVSQPGMDALIEELNQRHGPARMAAVARRVDWNRSRLFERLCSWAGIGIQPLSRHKPPRAFFERKRKLSAERIEEDNPETPPPAEGRLYQTPRWEEEPEPDRPHGQAGHSPLATHPAIPRDLDLRRHETLAQIVHTLHPCPRGFEAEPGHYVLSKESLESLVPVEDKASGRPVSQVGADVLDTLLLARLRFRPTLPLNILETAQQCIRQHENPRFKVGDIPLDDETAFRLLRRGLTNGIPPLHGIGAKALLRERGPDAIPRLVEVLEASQHPAEAQAPDPARQLPAAILSYWCAYLKAHYPVSFMTALLSHALRNPGPGPQPRFQILLREARRMGIEILPPHINLSRYAFTQEDQNIRLGLAAIQGLGEKAYQEIETARRSQAFSSLADFCHRTNPALVKKNVVTHLIKAGAFDSFGQSRARLLVDFERALKNVRQRATGNGERQLQLFDPSFFEDPARMPAPTHDNDPQADEDDPAKILHYEQQALGYPIRYDQLDYYEQLMAALGAVTPYELGPKLHGKALQVAGFIDHVEREGPLVAEPGALALDLEGRVVHVSAELAPRIARFLRARGPVLIEGRAHCPNRHDCRVEALEIHLLEEIADKSAKVGRIELNLAGADNDCIAGLRRLFRSYKGQTQVEVQTGENAKWWNLRGVAKARVFYCPPLMRGLFELLPESRIKLLDRQGRRLQP